MRRSCRISGDRNAAVLDLAMGTLFSVALVEPAFAREQQSMWVTAAG